MDAIKLLLTSESGLLSVAVILFMVVMGAYLYLRIRRLMNAKPGTEGWG